MLYMPPATSTHYFDLRTSVGAYSPFRALVFNLFVCINVFKADCEERLRESIAKELTEQREKERAELKEKRGKKVDYR